MEVPEHCVQSMLQIREYLTEELQNLPTDKGLTYSLRAMRAACRRFLETTQSGSGDIIMFGCHLGHSASWVFNGAVGELRGTFGHHVATIAAQYGLAVEDEPDRGSG